MAVSNGPKLTLDEERPDDHIASEGPLEAGRRYDFFRLVRMLTRRRPGALAPGWADRPEDENVRFRASASLGFAAADVEEILVSPEDPTRFGVTVNFMGLYGPASPMPTHLTEEILWGREEAQTLRDFLDVFNHRMISLFYRSWEKYRYPVQFEPHGRDEFTRRVLCLIGLGTDAMEEAAGTSLAPLLRTAGALASRRRSAAGLEGFLRAHFEDIPVEVLPCLARTVEIPEDQLLRLGSGCVRLGEDSCLGERIPDRSGAFRIVLGPMKRDDYEGFLPADELGRRDGEKLARLAKLVRLYVADPLDFDVVLCLRAGELPALALSAEADMPLGYMSWLTPKASDGGSGRLPVQRFDPLTVQDQGRNETKSRVTEELDTVLARRA